MTYTKSNLSYLIQSTQITNFKTYLITRQTKFIKLPSKHLKILETTNPTHVIRFAEGKKKLDCFFYAVDQSPPPEIGKLVEFHKIWQNARSSSELPMWKDFSFEDFIGWHSHIRVIDMGEDLHDKKHNIIIGEAFAKYWGRKTLYEQIHSENPPSQATIDQYIEYLTYIYDGNYCICVGLTPVHDDHLSSTTWIDLPAANNGKDVTHVISAIFMS